MNFHAHATRVFVARTPSQSITIREASAWWGSALLPAGDGLVKEEGSHFNESHTQTQL